MTRVLPLPAPARMRSGPSTVSTASRCCGLSWSRRVKALKMRSPAKSGTLWLLYREVSNAQPAVRRYDRSDLSQGDTVLIGATMLQPRRGGKLIAQHGSAGYAHEPYPSPFRDDTAKSCTTYVAPKGACVLCSLTHGSRR